MINISYFQNWLTEIYRPCAIVYSSDLAQKAINKNNLSPSDFLRPFGDFKNKKIDLCFQEKSNTTSNTTIRNFFFDFYDSLKCKTVYRKNIQNYLTVMFEFNSPKWNLNSPIVTKSNMSPFINLIDSYSTPWYKEYEELLFECQKFDEYELFQQPFLSVCLCLITEDPSEIKKIKSGKNVPKLVSSGIYETPKDNLIIVLNDVSDENNKLSDEEIQKNITKFKNEFKNNIFFWDINRNKKKPDESDQMFSYEINKNSEYWKRYFHKTDLYNPESDFYRNKNNKFGALISQSDIKKYKDEFQNFFIKTFLSQINALVQNYNDIIKRNKSKKISAIFKINKKDEIIYHPNTYVYKFNELERAYFNLGLLCFFFRNYDLAYDTFKLLYGCVKHKAPQHKEKLKLLIAILKFLTYLNKKEYNFNEEMKLKANTPELLIKKEIILIKMLEYNKNFPLLITKIKEFMEITKPQFKTNTNVSALDYFFPLLYEKIGIYYIYEDYFRKFLYYMVYSGKYFNKLGAITKAYSLFCFSNLLKFVDEPSTSFLTLRKKITKKMSKLCNNLNYYEGGYKFSKNCLEFSILYDEIKKMKKEEEVKEGDEQSFYIGIFLNMLNKLNNMKELDSKIDITSLDIPQIDNGSLLVVEENDYNVKKINEKIIYDSKPWTIFNHYKKSYFNNPYVNLDNRDLSRIILLNDIIQPKKMISNFYSRRQFYGNVNQKLYVKCIIKNPLLVFLQIASIKLYCDFIPEKKENTSEITEDKKTEENSNTISENNTTNNINISNNNSNSDCLICSEQKYNLKPLEEVVMEFSVSSSVPGKIIVKGLILLLFQESKIIHLFNKKKKNRLYYHRHKAASSEPNASGKARKTTIDSNSDSEPTTEKSQKTGVSSLSDMLAMQIKSKGKKFSKKSKIEYIVKDYNDDVYLDFPLGLDIDIYLYQLIFFPIIINNTSSKHRIRRFTIFLESLDDTKIKTFYNYITKDIELNPDKTNQKVLIPLLPISNDDKTLYIKVLIKCADEMRINPIEVKKVIIKLNIKNSIFFEIKESYNNLNSFDKTNNTFRQIDFSLKTDIRIKNKDDFSNLSINDPIFNDKIILNSRQNYILNDSDIHEMFRFSKDENIKNNSDNKDKFDFILKNKDIYGIEKIDESNNHIFDKFNKTINNINRNVFLFPWTAEISKQKKKIQGLYLYELNLSGPELTKDFIREIFYNSTETKIVKQKVNNEKTLIVIDLSLNKNGIGSLSEIITQYDIMINNKHPQISWLGLQKYTVINKIDKKEDNMFLCKFSFITTLKGIFEVNRISTVLYKKNYEKNITENFMTINHITKPISILID